MIKNSIIIFAATLIYSLTFSCYPSKELNNQKEEIKELIINDNYDFKTLKSDYTIQLVTLEDSTLNIELTYKGGCGKHDFNLIFDGRYAKSLPPKATMFLQHYSKDEKCDNTINKSLKFNISKVKDKTGNKVFVNVFSFREFLPYSY